MRCFFERHVMTDQDPVISLNSVQDFKTNVLETDEPTIIDFWAPWCQPCLMTSPHFHKAARKCRCGTRFFQDNVDEPGACEMMQACGLAIKKIPTKATFFRGAILDVHIGFSDYEHFMARAMSAKR